MDSTEKFLSFFLYLVLVLINIPCVLNDADMMGLDLMDYEL